MTALLLTAWLALRSGASKVWRWVTQDGHWKLVAAAMTAALIILLVHSYRASKAEIAIAKADLSVAKGEVVLLDKARISDNAAIVSAQGAKAAIATKEAQGSEATNAALAANPDWANQPIPADVVNSLSM